MRGPGGAARVATHREKHMVRWLDAALDYIPSWLDYQVQQTQQPGCLLAIVHDGKVVLERFHTPDPALSKDQLTIRRTRPLATLAAPVGITLLAALEAEHWPINAACRAGVCGCCKTRIIDGRYHTTSTLTLSEREIADGYVLACSCYPEGDIVIA